MTAFRSDRGLPSEDFGVPPALVDPEVVDHLWKALEEAGLATEARRRIRPFTLIRR